MNEGTITLLVQWCFLCLIWMGSFDGPLSGLGFTRSNALTLITVFLLCSFVSWRLYFLPIELTISGALLPSLLAGWLYTRLEKGRRRLYLISALLSGTLLCMFRILLFKDPVLLVLDERLLIPIGALVGLFALTRNVKQQLFFLLFVFLLADIMFTCSFLKKADRLVIGGDYAQDLLWSTLSLWSIGVFVWTLVRKGIALIVRH